MPAFNFNSQQYDPQFGGGLKQFPPAKKMKVIAFESSQQPTKDGKGGYLQFLLRCIEGPHQGAEGFVNFNLHNISAQAVEIANKQLSAMCHCVGVYAFSATEQLHNIPFLIDVDWQKGNEPTQEKPEGGYTQVTAMYDVNGNPPGKAGSGPQRQPAPVAPPPAQPPANVAPASPAPVWGQQPQTPPAPQGWQQQPAQPAQAPAWGNNGGGWAGK